MPHEIHLPGLSTKLQQEAAQAQSAQEYRAKKAAEKEARKRQRIKDAAYLQKSPVAEVFIEAARLLNEGGHNTSLSVTNPEPTGVYKPYGDSEDTRQINIRLAWDISGREDGRQLIGSDDYHATVYSWREVNAELVRTEAGRVKGFKFNIHPSTEREHYRSQSFEVGTSLADVVSAVDQAIAQPLYLDEEGTYDGSSPHRSTYNNEGRIELPITSPKAT